MEKEKSKFLSYLILSYLILCVVLIATPLKISAKSSKSNSANFASQARSEWANFKEMHGHKWQVKWDHYTGLPRTIMGKGAGNSLRGRWPDAAQNATEFMVENRGLLGVEMNNLELVKVNKSKPFKHVKFRQVWQGIPVVGKRVMVHLKDDCVDNSRIIGYSSNYDPWVMVEDPQPRFSVEEGIGKAHYHLGKNKRLSSEPKARLVILKDRHDSGKYKLCWQVKLSLENHEGWAVYVDAHTGEEIERGQLNVKNHGYVAGRIFPNLPTDTLKLRPIGGQELVLGLDPVSALTDMWGGYGNKYTVSLYTELSGPYCKIVENEDPDNPNIPLAFYISGTPAEYNWMQTSTPTGITGDDKSVAFSLNFSFPFYGQNYTTIYICSNGYLGFSGATMSYAWPIPSAFPPNDGIIAPFFRDLNPSQGGQITYFSDANQFVATWDQVPDYYSGSPQTFQAILKPDGTILFQYKDINPESATPIKPTSIGIEDLAGQNGVGYYDFPGNGTVIEFQSSPDFSEVKCASSFCYSNSAVSDFDFNYSYEWKSTDTPTGIKYDDQYVEIPLVFDFSYYNQTYNTIYVCSNGFVSLSPSSAYSPDPIPSTGAPNGIIAPFWRDLNPYMGGTITYTQHDTGDLNSYIVVTWEGVPNYGYIGNPQTFQVILYAWGGIVFQYKNITMDKNTSIGIEDYDGSNGKACKGTPHNHSAVMLMIWGEYSAYDKPPESIPGYTPEPTGITTENGYAGIDFDPNFSATYYGKEYNRLYISANGFVSFSEEDMGASDPDTFPNSNTPNGIIAPFWTDLDPSIGGEITYFNNSEVFIVIWKDIPQNDYPYHPQTFSLRLYKEGRISFAYGNLSFNKSTGIGIENSAGSAGYDAGLKNNTAIRYYNSVHGFTSVREEYNWIETSTNTGITGDDQCESFDLPFGIFLIDDFWFPSVNVCSNGFLSKNYSTYYFSFPIPHESNPEPLIAPFFRDLNPNMGGTITYLSDSDKFVVTWDHVPNYPSGTPQTFQAILYSTGDIVFQYKDITFDKRTSIGLQSSYTGRGYTLPKMQFYPQYNNSLVWGFSEDSKHQDEVNAFYHINLFHDYLTKDLDLSFSNFEKVKVRVRSGGNSQYDDSKIIFLNKDTEGARYAKTIHHEYTHFYQHNVYGHDFWENEDLLEFQHKAAMEACADYLPSAFTDNPIMYGVLPERDISEDKIYPSDWSTDEHTTGLILSSALWDIREAFDQDPLLDDVSKYDADWIAAKVLGFEPFTFLEFREKYEYIDSNIYGGEHIDTIGQIFEEHGIDPKFMPKIVDGINWIETPIETGITFDTQHIEVPLPFPFTFYRQTYNSIFISGKGYLSFFEYFDSSIPYYDANYEFKIPSVDPPNNLISPYARMQYRYFNSIDYEVNVSGATYESTPDMFVVSWHVGIWTYGDEEDAEWKFQVILKPTGSITFQYDKLWKEQQENTLIGIENHDGAEGITYPQQRIYDGMGLIFED